MKKIFLISIFVFISFNLFAKKSQPVPDWVLNYQNVFPDSKFIAQKGNGKTADEAKSDAAANISFYFETNVNAKREVNFKSFESGTDENLKIKTEQNVVRETKIDTSTNLNAVEFTEPWKNKKDKSWHCVAFVEREVLWNQYEPELRVAKDNFKGYYEKAEKTQEPFEKIRMLGMAYNKGATFLEKLSYAQFLSETLTNQKYEQDILLLSQINSVQQKVKNEMPIFIEVKNDFGNMVYSVLSQLLEEDGFTIVKNRSDAVYIAEVILYFEQQTVNQILVFSPSVQISLKGENANVYTYSKECGTVKAYSDQVGMKKCVQKITDNLNANFKNDFNSAMNG